MTRLIIFCICSICWVALASPLLKAQPAFPGFHDSLFSTYYQQRQSHFQLLPSGKGDIIFAGNSITDGAEWVELFNHPAIKNRGISGDNSAGILHRLESIVRNKPDKIFLMIGINDLGKGISPDSVFRNIRYAAEYIRSKTPATRLFVQSILPVNPVFGKFMGQSGKTKQVSATNQLLQAQAIELGYTYIDLHPHFTNDSGFLDSRFTNDGLHLSGRGYQLWKHLVFPYVFDLGAVPGLIPKPQNLLWTQGRFPLYICNTIQLQDSSLARFGRKLAEWLPAKNGNVITKISPSPGQPVIQISLGAVPAGFNEQEAYKLRVNNNLIQLTANTAHGIHNGLQTLRQLMRDGAFVNNCEITDWPVFNWRGYMIDVGRNYMPVDLLKQQIDVMSGYKMNVFHFHATEDIAWRIAIDRYPELTAPENMLRNKGLYYSGEEILDLVDYCNERFITFVPEIDMPGHSDAFKRALKYPMQSDSGLAMVKQILHEFCQTYPVPYIHIGADEVKISNPSFIPEVTKLIESYGKKVIGWQPGGNFSNSTIRQLWADDKTHLADGGKFQFIDSRQLYLNHMDPLEAVTTIFNRQIGDTTHGTAGILGGTLCVWHDRSVASPADILRMNPVYPGMLAFAERSWIGGGEKGWITNISDGNEKEFAGFEERLLNHRKLYFSHLPFPYVKQSQLRWKLFGPYPNDGDLQKKFGPGEPAWEAGTANPVHEVSGGTVVLRHWWAPLIKGAIAQPVENSTWYAVTKLWSPVEGTAGVWIGFNNISRASATDSPPANEWDRKYSRVWVNGKMIHPPQWKRPGQKGHPEIPLTDEGYEYRAPSQIALKKGWNTILVKLPVGSFKGTDWQNPVKWMFTFAPVDDNDMMIQE